MKMISGTDKGIVPVKVEHGGQKSDQSPEFRLQ